MSLDTSSDYPDSPRSRVKRMPDRGSYDRATVHGILDAGMLCHVSYVIDGQPYCTPTIHWRDGDRLYWHGSSASRMLRHLKTGTPACLTVSHLDGLVLARCGFNHSANYRSAMCFGTAEIVSDLGERAQALLALVDRFYPSRSADLRQATAQEAKATMVIGMRIEEASAKIRAKGVGDEADDLEHPVWAGVIPVKTVIGTAARSTFGRQDMPFPPGLAPYAEGHRLDAALLATQAIYEGVLPQKGE